MKTALLSIASASVSAFVPVVFAQATSQPIVQVAGLPSFETIAAQIATYVAKVWPKMGEIWPGADYSDITLILTDGTRVMAATPTSFRELSREEAASVRMPPPGGFDIAPFAGRASVVLRLDPIIDLQSAAKDLQGTALQIFRFATHEAFHAYVQPNWAEQTADETEDESRSTKYPLELEPRLLRYFVFLELKQAYIDEEHRNDHLAAAAFWYRRWQAEFPKEAAAARGTDLSESTARYIDAVAFVRALNGFEAALTSPVLREQLENSLEIAGRPEVFTAVDSESYSLGLVAGLLANDLGRGNWPMEVATMALTPLDIVFAGVPETNQPYKEPQGARERLERVILQENDKLVPIIEPFLERYKDPSTSILAIPIRAMQGSFGLMGFFAATGVPFDLFANLEAEYVLQNGSLHVSEVTAGAADVQACGEGFFNMLFLRTSEFELNGSMLSVHAKGLEGVFDVKTTRDDQDKQVFCAL